MIDGHKAALAFTEDQNHMLLYTTAAPFQNMPVKGARMLHTQILPSTPPCEPCQARGCV